MCVLKEISYQVYEILDDFISFEYYFELGFEVESIEIALN